MASTSQTRSTGKSGGSSASSAKKTAPARSATSAVALLEKDHREVERYFERFEKLKKSEDKIALAEKICTALRVHTQIEEEIFYPAARAAIEEDMIDEAIVEHASAKQLLTDIEGMQPEDDLFDAKVKVLSEYVKHHVKEEEEEMFPESEKADMDMDSIGKKLAARKKELMAEIQSADDDGAA